MKSDPKAKRPVPPDRGGSPAADGGVRVILVEDSAADAELVMRELRRVARPVTIERVDALDALARALAHPADLIIADHAVGPFQGLDALRVARDSAPGVPFILVTGSLDDETAVSYLRAGAADYVLKDRLNRLAPAVEGVLTATEERQRLAGERDLLARVVAQLAESVLITDTSARIEYVNPAFTAITGYTLDEVRGRTPAVLKSDQQDPSFYQTLWGELVEGRTWTGRLVNRRKDGTFYHQDTVISVVRGTDDRTVHYVGVGRDVTREIELEQQLRQAQRLEAVGQLASGIAHDFNNILGVILASAQLARGAPAGPAALVADLAEIERAAERARGMVRQLLGFSRRTSLTMVPTDLGALAARAADTLRRLLPENIAIQVRPAERLPAVRVDPGAVEQILMNLATNARDAMPDGGTLTVHLDERLLDDAYREHHPWVVPGRYLCLAVEDTGEGMPQNVQARVFDPFFTTKPVGKGSGLGLAMVYGLVKQHLGFIHVYSEVGLGTTFRVYFPVAEGITHQSARAARVPPAPQGRGETVLLVEDEPALRRVGKRVLEDAGYRVVEATDGEEALHEYRLMRDTIRLVVSDLIMPNAGGRQLYEWLRAEFGPVPFLLATGYADRFDDGADGLAIDVPLLLKPWTINELLEAVRNALDGQAV